jgi:hypothetical protein
VIKTVRVWSFEARPGATVVRTEESWKGLVPRLVPGFMRNMLQGVIEGEAKALKAEAERRATAGGGATG